MPDPAETVVMVTYWESAGGMPPHTTWRYLRQPVAESVRLLSRIIAICGQPAGGCVYDVTSPGYAVLHSPLISVQAHPQLYLTWVRACSEPDKIRAAVETARCGRNLSLVPSEYGSDTIQTGG